MKLINICLVYIILQALFCSCFKSEFQSDHRSKLEDKLNLNQSQIIQLLRNKRAPRMTGGGVGRRIGGIGSVRSNGQSKQFGGYELLDTISISKKTLFLLSSNVWLVFFLI